MQNIEFKAELRDPALARTILQASGATPIGILEQTDTYYRIPSGRFKKRESVLDGMPEPVEYIRYDRADDARARTSDFTIYSETAARERFGEVALGLARGETTTAAASPTGSLPIRVVVKKQRELWMLGNVRIHLDDVLGLGKFIELEALVSTSHSPDRCHEIVARLRELLSPALGELIATSYADMLDPAG